MSGFLKSVAVIVAAEASSPQLFLSQGKADCWDERHSDLNEMEKEKKKRRKKHPEGDRLHIPAVPYPKPSSPRLSSPHSRVGGVSAELAQPRQHRGDQPDFSGAAASLRRGLPH